MPTKIELDSVFIACNALDARVAAQSDVIIVNYNAGSLLTDCVFSIFAAGMARAIVVDNHSTDGSVESLVRIVENEQLIVIRKINNLRFAAACNIGAQASTAHQMLFLKLDYVLDPDALTKMGTALRAADNVGMVGGLVCNPDGSE